jgi:FkbM family methyltransferase
MESYKLCLDKVNFANDYVPIFFDVGCNINYIPEHCGILDDFTELGLSMYPNSKFYGLDPLHWQNYEKKWKNDSRVVVIKKALSDSTENKILYIPNISITPVSHAISSLFDRKCFEDVGEIEVECTTLDFIFNQFNLERIDYLKVDTEGSEFSILRGGKEVLENKKINYIQLEYGGTYEDAGFTILDIISYLSDYGYTEIFRTHSELLFANKEITQ